MRNGIQRGNRWNWISAVGLTCLLAGIASCTPSDPAKTDQSAATLPTPAGDATPLTANTFVGSETCATCHPNESKDHAGTNHARTLQMLDRKSLGKLSPPAGPIPNTAFALAASGDQFGIVPKSNPDGMPHLLELAFGSGKSGMTYVKVLGTDAIAELHMSYFPKFGKWYVTPGTEKLGPENMGRLQTGDVPRACVLCHAVTLPDDSLIPEKRFLGVGCESCHGPGSSHIAAVQAGKTREMAIDSLRAAGGDKINEVCGACHRLTNDDAPMKTASDTARFQPYGLSLSKCFTRSNNTLTCITCHNPHTNARTDARYYETACLKCHTASPATVAPPNRPSVGGKPCPVNPKTNCVSCHMPRLRAFSDTQLPTTMPDHYIRKPEAKGRSKQKQP